MTTQMQSHEGRTMETWETESLPICSGVKRSNLTVLLAVAFIVFTTTGCGTLQNGRGWGQDAIYPVELKRISHAAYHAFFDLQTLLPAAGALVFTLDDYDHRVSKWATIHHPIFGSGNSARQAGNNLDFGLEAETLLTALATPSGKDPKDWTSNKTKGVGVELGAELATAGVTGLLKRTSNHTRPSGGNNGFPSGHSSNAFSSATLANRNLNSINMPEEVRMPLQVGNIVLATGVSWARVEGGEHNPTDVLAGAALGHFISAFLYDAFMGVPEHKRWELSVSPTKGGAMIGVSFDF
jgi:membrane-associated phospholipid phosphatase